MRTRATSPRALARAQRLGVERLDAQLLVGRSIVGRVPWVLATPSTVWGDAEREH